MEELFSLHRIYCECEKCVKARAVRALELEACHHSPYFRSPEKERLKAEWQKVAQRFGRQEDKA